MYAQMCQTMCVCVFLPKVVNETKLTQIYMQEYSVL